MKKVSVIIPTYNGADYVCDTIDSVLAQTYNDYEIIVVDDGSTDNTSELLAKYNGKIIYIYQENKGCSVARNRAIEMSKGEFIAFLDHDDVWVKDKLEKQMKLIESEGADFIHSAANVISNRPVEQKLKPRSPAYNFNDLFLKGKSIVMSSALVRRKCLPAKAVFDENIISINDYDLWLRIIDNCRVKFINEPLVIYQIHNSNISANEEAVRKDGIKICKKLMKNIGIPNRLAKRQLSREHYMLSMFYRKIKAYNKSTREIVKAIKAYPLIGISFIYSSERLRNKILKVIKPYLLIIYVFLLSILRKNRGVRIG